MTPRRIAVIGYGAIGRPLVAALLERRDPPFDVAILLPSGSASRAALPSACTVADDVAALRRFAPDLAVETAGAAAVREHGPACLALGAPLLLASVGALHDDALRHDLVAAAVKGRTRLYLPSGALAGLDYVRATRGASEATVTYTSRKPPAAWRDELARLGHPAEPDRALILFEGSAREAASRYPANLNVAATLALAGIGFDETRVVVALDPEAGGNTHAVAVTSEYGTLEVTVRNRPSPDNPKTSWIVSRSLLAAIDQHFSPVLML